MPTDGHALLNSPVTPGQPYDTPLLSRNSRLSGVEAEKNSVRLPLGVSGILHCLTPSSGPVAKQNGFHTWIPYELLLWGRACPGCRSTPPFLARRPGNLVHTPSSIFVGALLARESGYIPPFGSAAGNLGRTPSRCTCNNKKGSKLIRF